MFEKFRMWLGVSLIRLGLRVAGFYTGVKWQTFMMIGERRDKTPSDYDFLRDAVIENARNQDFSNPEVYPDFLIQYQRERWAIRQMHGDQPEQ